MKSIKYFTAAILILLSVAFIGEYFVWQVNSFENEYRVFILSPLSAISAKDTAKSIENAASKHGVKAFIVEREMKDMLSVKTNIYGTKGVKEHLEDHSSLYQGKYNSVFAGVSEVTMRGLDKIPSDMLIRNVYAVGNDDALFSFRDELPKEYDASNPRGRSTTDDIEVPVIVIWSIVYVLLLLMTSYDVIKLKKEVLIRMICGELPRDYVMKNMVRDIIVLSTIFVSSLLFLYRFVNVFYEIRLTALCFFLFLILNSVAYAGALRTDFKKDVVSRSQTKGMIRMGYIYITCFTVVAVASISITFGVVYDGLSFYSQKSFFEQKTDYFYDRISTTLLGDKNTPTDVALQEIEENETMLYNTYSNKKRTACLVNLGTIDGASWNGGTDVLYADTGAYEYLSGKIPEVKGVNLKKNVVYIVMSKENDGNPSALSDAKIQYARYFGEEGSPVFETILYEKAPRIISVSNYSDLQANSGYSKNPTILLFGRHMKALSGFISQSVMYRLDEKELVLFKNSLKHPENAVFFSTNVYEAYERHLNRYKYEAYICGIIGVIFLLILITVMASIIRNRYDAFAVQLMIEKLCGHTKIEQHGGVIFFTIGLIGLSSVAALLLNTYAGITNNYAILSAATIIAIISVASIILNIRRMEKAHIQKILKGGWT